LLQVNSSISNTNNNVTDNIIENFNNEKKKNLTHKNGLNENTESKFSISQLKEKNDSYETHKKGFFMVTDEIREEDDISLKIKRDILVSKLMCDKAIIIDKHLRGNFNENVLTSIFLTLSNESRKALLEGCNFNDSNESSNFHNLIGFNRSSVKNWNIISNEAIMNMCENFVKLDDCIIIIYITSFYFHSADKRGVK
jgi:hypothetical protein